MKRFTIDKLPAPSHNANNPVFMKNARYYNGMVSFGAGYVHLFTYAIFAVRRVYRLATFVQLDHISPTFGVFYHNGAMEIAQVEYAINP